MPSYRIRESRHDNGVSMFYPQRKGWFFWHDFYEKEDDGVCNDGLPCYTPPTIISFITLEQAKAYINKLKPKHITRIHEV